jgi:tetratricopeptide (TPR) repeat protein
MTASQWKVGDRIQDRWEVRRLMKGGLGQVLVLYDPTQGDVVAAKTFRREVFERNHKTADLFEHEAQLWINLDAHENVAQAYSVEIIEGYPYLFLEFVSGGDLRKWIGDPRLTLNIERVLRLALQFCDGLAHAHSKGIAVHLDIKPENCLLAQDDTLKVADFGLARLASDMREDRVGGTPLYMSPEQWAGSSEIDIRSDVYSFGIMLYEMVNGKLPFVTRSAGELRQLHQEAAVPALCGGALSLDPIVQKCVSKRSIDRFQGFFELRAALAAVYKELVGVAPREPATEKRLNELHWINKGYSLDNLGEHEQAASCYDRALQAHPDSAIAWANKSAAMGQLERYQDEIECAERALRCDRSCGDAWANKIAGLVALEKYAEGLQCADEAIVSKIDHPQVWTGKGMALLGQARHQDALEALDRALGLNPFAALTWENKGKCLLAWSDPSQAKECFVKALQLNPRRDSMVVMAAQSPEEAKAFWEELAEAALKTARVLTEQGNFEEAVTAFDNALRFSPKRPEVWSAKAGLFGQLKKYSLELEACEFALTLDPNHARAWNNKGAALFALGNHRDALDCCKRAVELVPDYAQARKLVALCEKAMDEDARIESEQWLVKGSKLADQGRHDDAINCFDQALRINPHSAPTWFVKANLMCRMNRRKEEVECYDRALEINPNYAEAWSMKASALGLLSKFDQALLCCNRALELKPNLDSAWRNKGTTMLLLNRVSEALASFEEAKRLGDTRADEPIAYCRKILADSAIAVPRAVDSVTQGTRDIEEKNGGGWLRRLLGGRKKG